MEAYFQFLLILAIGLTAMSTVLKILLDKIFHDWDVISDINEFWTVAYREKNFLRLERTEDIMMEKERGLNPSTSTRLVENKAQLKKLAETADQLTVG